MSAELHFLTSYSFYFELLHKSAFPLGEYLGLAILSLIGVHIGSLQDRGKQLMELTMISLFLSGYIDTVGNYFATTLTLAICTYYVPWYFVLGNSPFETLLVSWIGVLLPVSLIGVYAGCLSATITFVACKAVLIVAVEMLDLAERSYKILKQLLELSDKTADLIRRKRSNFLTITTKKIKEIKEYPLFMQLVSFNLTLTYIRSKPAIQVTFLQGCILEIGDTQLLSRLTQGNSLYLQSTLLSHPNFPLLELLYRCHYNFLHPQGSRSSFLSQVKRVRTIPRKAWEVYEMREFLEKEQGRPMVLWMVDSRDTGRVGRLGKPIWLEVVQYI